MLRLIEGLLHAGVESTLLARRRLAAVSRRARNEAGAWNRSACCARCHAGARSTICCTRTTATAIPPGAIVSPGESCWYRGASPSRSRSRVEVRRARHYLAVSEFVKGVLHGGRRAAKRRSAWSTTACRCSTRRTARC